MKAPSLPPSQTDGRTDGRALTHATKVKKSARAQSEIQTLHNVCSYNQPGGCSKETRQTTTTSLHTRTRDGPTKPTTTMYAMTTTTTTTAIHRAAPPASTRTSTSKPTTRGATIVRRARINPKEPWWEKNSAPNMFECEDTGTFLNLLVRRFCFYLFVVFARVSSRTTRVSFHTCVVF